MARMNRLEARELAVRLCYGMAANGRPAQELLEEIFDPEYYASLGQEDEMFQNTPDDTEKLYISRLVTGVYEHSAELDGYISKYALGWNFARITRSAVAVIKTAMYEVLYMDDIPDAAAINAAVEIAKKYEDAETVRFVNGVLGGFKRGEKVERA